MVKQKTQKKAKLCASIISVIVFLVMAYALYYAFMMAGIDSLKAIVESIVISTTLITLVALFLFGRIWKKELKTK